MEKIRIYVDMDGVMADFERAIVETGLEGPELKLIQGTYLNLHPYPGAFDALDKLEEMGFEIRISTKIPRNNLHAASEKLFWLERYRPKYISHTTITNDKGDSGRLGDYIIDDRPHKANVSNFNGTLLDFGPKNTYKDWDSILKFFIEKVNKAL